MNGVVERERVRKRKRAIEYAKNLSEINQRVADNDIKLGNDYLAKGNYRYAAKAYRHAASFYGEASRDPKLSEDAKEHLGDLHDGAMKKYKGLLHKAAFEKATAHMSPGKKLIAKVVDWWKVTGFFIFSILFSSESITGAAIGSREASSYLGILFFFLGIVGCYLMLWKRHLLNRFQDQY